MSSRQTIPAINTEEELRVERRAARMNRRKHCQRARWILWGTIASCILLLGSMGFTFLHIQKDPINNSTYPPINGIPCDTAQTAYHIHAHLTIYINGQFVSIPKNIGIAADGSCFYWMHTNTG